ncbi:MAG: MBL fold metallo-hydrolase [Lachnospiraceae bacterium]|nr:MBL fold metallo-hydrolase [Lachnospiraceae bacterium]
MKDPVLLYQGHASLRIVTGDDKVIYIDPFSGEGYDMPADLILQTHDHFDHKDMSRISDRNDDCRVITQAEALSGGEHQSFDMGYVKVEAVEAGYNKNHDKKNCVGYILTFPNDVSVYVSGDTSKTEQMSTLGSRNIDYAFYCCDGVYNMDAAEASECAALVGAKVNIPYHTGSAAVTAFDEENAKRFNAPGATIVTPGSELILK